MKISNTKKPKLENIPFIHPENLKETECEACKGQGNINGRKCAICGGSGSKDRVNILQNFVSIDKGKPQKKYEIIIRDVEDDKILYKNAGFGGVLATIDRIDEFSGKVVEGNYQSAMWGNPLVQRFGIDRLEEQFAKNIDNYVDAMEQAGMFFADRDKIKKILIEGNILKLQKIMGIEIDKIDRLAMPKNPLGKETQTMSEEDKTRIINKVTEIINRQGSYAFLLIEKANNNAVIETIVRGMGPKDVVLSSIESAITLYEYKQGQSLSNLEKAKVALSLLKNVATDIINKYKPN